MLKKRIGIGGISTECSTYSPLYQNHKDFKIIEKKELLNLINFNFKKHNIEILPIFFAKSLPGGPIENLYFRKLKNNFIKKIKQLSPLDGLVLIMHGAMYVPKIYDPEGDWISSIRKILGKKCIISLIFDLHGQITNKIIKNIDTFSAFRTAPHIDVSITYQRAFKMLIKTLNNNIKPKVVWAPIPVLVSGEMSSTYINPCKKIYNSLNKFDEITGILDSNLMIGYVWADTKRATAAAVITCTDTKIGSKICIKIANLYWKNRKKLKFNMKSGNIESTIKFISDKFSIFSDSGDNPTAGGVGDRVDILSYILKNNLKKSVLFAGIYSKDSYNKLLKNKNFTIGGCHGGGGPSLNLVADKVYFKEDCAIVNIKKITIVITKYRRPFHKLDDFSKLDLNLYNYNLLVVKSGYLSPDLNDLSSSSYMILSKGAVDQNLLKIVNIKRNRPIYPFQNFKNFIPKVYNY